MDFALDQETQLLVDTVRRFVETELQPHEAAIEAAGIMDPALAQSVFEKSRALGLFAMNIPAELGGGGLDTVQFCLVEEQAGRTKDILVRRAFGNVYEVLLACDDSQSQRWLRPAIVGERVCSIAITEPGAGSDAAAITTRAVPDGDGWRLFGHKHFISDGEFSDFFVVSAATDPDAGARGISLFLVDKGLPGFEVGRNQPMMGLAGTSHVELHFDQVPLEGGCLLGEPGGGLKLAYETLGRIRLAQVGARAVGAATRALEMMIDHAASRRQFGRRIGDFQLVSQMLADSAMEIAAARLMLLNAAWDLDQGRDAREKISMVKIHAAETYNRVADRAVQVFGGSGYCKDLPLERFYRDSRIGRIYDGTSEIHRGVIARALLAGDHHVLDPW